MSLISRPQIDCRRIPETASLAVPDSRSDNPTSDQAEQLVGLENKLASLAKVINWNNLVKVFVDQGRSILRRNDIAMMVSQRNLAQEHRCSNRGSVYLFAPMIDFNVMSEVGDAPP